MNHFDIPVGDEQGSDSLESVVICSKGGVNAVWNRATGKFDALLSDFFFLNREEYGYWIGDFENLPDDETKFLSEYVERMMEYAAQREAKHISRG